MGKATSVTVTMLSHKNGQSLKTGPGERVTAPGPKNLLYSTSGFIRLGERDVLRTAGKNHIFPLDDDHRQKFHVKDSVSLSLKL